MLVSIRLSRIIYIRYWQPIREGKKSYVGSSVSSQGQDGITKEKPATIAIARIFLSHAERNFPQQHYYRNMDTAHASEVTALLKSGQALSNDGESKAEGMDSIADSVEANGLNEDTSGSKRSVRFTSTSFRRLESSASSIRSFIHHLTHSERDRVAQEKGIGAAAFLVRDAVLGQVENPAEGAYDPYANPEEPWRNTVAIVCGRLCAYRPLLSLLYSVAWMMVTLTFLEPPHWCRTLYGTDSDDDGGGLSTSSSPGCHALFAMEGTPADKSSLDPVQLYPNSKSTVLTIATATIAESICVAIVAIFLLMRIGRDGFSLKRYLRPGTAQISRVVQLLCVIFLVIGLLTGVTMHHPYVRLAILLSLSPAAQRDIGVLVKMLPEVMNILLILGVFMVFYAWFGTVMFVGTEEGSMHFSSLIESMWTLWICVTTANYPDVMMPEYNQNRWVTLYFISFMILSFFFLMNLVLAAVFNEYQLAFQTRKQDRTKASDENLRKAYALMDSEGMGRIDQETVMALFCILNEDFPEFRTLSDEDTKLLFAILDKDGSSTITEEEFMDFGSVLLLEFVKTSAYSTFVELRLPKIFHSSLYQTFCTVVKSNLFEYSIDAILVMNAVVIGIQSYPELSGQAVQIDPKYWDGSIDTIWEGVESVFTVIYALEVVVKVLVLGWRAYTESYKNVFDFTITILAVISSSIVYYPNEFSDSRLIRMIVMARVLRLIRLLTAMKRFQLIGIISVEILPAASSALMVLFCIMYFFSALGMHLYGGLITRDPANSLAYLLLGTDFSENDYWANNFNDMISGMNVLFNMLVVNNWTECEVGFEATTQEKWVRFFFLSFHVCGVILVNNLVIAFIINAFFEELAIYRERTDEEIVGDGEAVIRNRRAVFDASEVTGTKTMLSGGYVARLRSHHSDVGDGHEQDRLRQLFTHRSSSMEIKTSSERSSLTPTDD
jgi:two pore calcium channel protein